MINDIIELVNYMDNYSLEDVKKLIDNNLLNKEILENILKTSTRRIENKNDNSAIEILRFLSLEKTIHKETKNQIEKYLSEYETYIIKNNEEKENGNSIIKLTLMYSLIIAIVALILILIIRGK